MNKEQLAIDNIRAKKLTNQLREFADKKEIKDKVNWNAHSLGWFLKYNKLTGKLGTIYYNQYAIKKYLYTIPSGTMIINSPFYAEESVHEAIKIFYDELMWYFDEYMDYFRLIQDE